MRRTTTPLPDDDLRRKRDKTRPYAIHSERNPAGSKFLRAFFRAKVGERGSYKEARVYYARRKL